MANADESQNRDATVGENPLARRGHVSYLEIPAIDPAQAATFYEAIFGWRIQRREGGHFGFDDRSGDLIGRWVTDRAVSQEGGIVPYIYVDGIEAIVGSIAAHGGEIIKPVYPEGDVRVATFRDPAGNLMGLWQFGTVP